MSFPIILVDGAGEVGSGLPVSEPMVVADDDVRLHSRSHSRRSSRASAATSRSTSRRNSWMVDDGAALAPSFDVAAETTLVELLSPGSTSDLVAPRAEHAPNGAPEHMFASPEAAAAYSRMMRRASWPLLLAAEAPPELVAHGVDRAGGSVNPAARQPSTTLPSKAHFLEPHPPPPRSSAQYHATPAVSPRRLARRLRELKDTTEDEHESIDASLDTADSISSDPPPSSPLPSGTTLSLTTVLVSPVVNLLLLGDDTCGLGSALDAFAGRDRGVGVTLKTRVVIVAGVAYRVRCWHAASGGRRASRREARATLSSALRNVQGILLIYDATRVESFDETREWFQVLREHTESVAAAAASRSQEDDEEGGGTTTINRPILLLGNRARLAAETVPQSSSTHTTDPVGVQSTVPVGHRRGVSLPDVLASEKEKAESESKTTAPTAQPQRDARLVSPAAVHAFLREMQESYVGGGRVAGSNSLVTSFEFNANLWRERYRVFRRAARMVAQAQHTQATTHTHGATSSGASSVTHSRAVSPVQEAGEGMASPPADQKHEKEESRAQAGEAAKETNSGWP